MEERIEELREGFDECDTNGDGKIQYAEFAALLDNLGSEIDAEECRIGFGEIDTDHDGVISFDEFVAWWSEH